jgi:hypothetical protein
MKKYTHTILTSTDLYPNTCTYEYSQPHLKVGQKRLGYIRVEFHFFHLNYCLTGCDIMWQAISLQFVSCLLLIACLAYCSTLKMESVFSSETSLNFYRTTRRHVPWDGTLHSYRCESLISNITLTLLFLFAMPHFFTCWYSLYYVAWLCNFTVFTLSFLSS